MFQKYSFDTNAMWLQALNDIMSRGELVSPSGKSTLELMGYQSVIDMKNPMITVPNRKMNYNFMCGEAWWIISGSNKVKDITPFMKVIANYSDDGITFNGAYGPKFIDQLWYVIRSLSDMPSRQAVINIWREAPAPSKDIPCTLSHQYMIRGGKLHCVATMRSSDIWRGWVYDTFNFSMMSLYVLLSLRQINPIFNDIQLGNLHLTAGSQHAYESDYPDIKNVLETTVPLTVPRPAHTINESEFASGDDLLAKLYWAGHERYDNCGKYLSQIEKFRS